MVANSRKPQPRLKKTFGHQLETNPQRQVQNAQRRNGYFTLGSRSHEKQRPVWSFHDRRTKLCPAHGQLPLA